MKTRLLGALSFLLICATQLGATDCGVITTDHGFDLWCGDRLCYWKLERGEIDKVASWHEGDDAVAFLGGDVAISQMTVVNSFDTDCIRIDMVANVDEAAEVRVEADVFGDGTIDWSERIPTSSWDPVSLTFGIAGFYDGILFRLTKVGPGDATLAQVKAEVSDTACPTYLDPLSRPLGAGCWIDADCDSGICNGDVCSACADAAGCDAGEVCGLVEEFPALLAPWHACVEEGSRALFEICALDAECATGVCNGLVCSECAFDTACPGGAACETDITVSPISMCEREPRAAGEPCAYDDHCASGACDGRAVGTCDTAVRTCFDDDECPAQADLTPGTCTFVAVAGGTCQ